MGLHLQAIAEALEDNWAVSVAIVMLYLASFAASFASGAAMPSTCCRQRSHDLSNLLQWTPAPAAISPWSLSKVHGPAIEPCRRLSSLSLMSPCVR